MRRVLICGVLCLGFTSASGHAFAEGPTIAPGAAQVGAAQTPATGQNAPTVQSAPAEVAPAAGLPSVESATPNAQPASPDASVVPAPSAPPIAPAPITPAQLPPTAAPSPAAPPAPAAPARSARVRDEERLPQVLPPPEPHGPFVRAQLGVGVALLTTGDDSQLRLPSFAHLDLGYQFSEAFALAVRVGTWLSYDKFGIAFLGVGVTHGFEPEGMFVTGVVGLSFQDPAFGISGDEERQGLAFHLDLGQKFTLAEQLYFSVGGHFEVGTPLGGSGLEFTGIGVGPFVSLRWGA